MYFHNIGNNALRLRSKATYLLVLEQDDIDQPLSMLHHVILSIDIDIDIEQDDIDQLLSTAVCFIIILTSLTLNMILIKILT